MNANDPNIAAVELVAIALGALREELVLVGGCSVGLLITDHARPPARQTVDVDLVAEVTSTTEFYALCEKLRQCGFSERADAAHMCRWHKGSLILDVMPSDESVLGHSSNRWYPEAVRSAMRTRLPRGTDMLVVSPPLFLATKLEAFYGRGGGDFGHHDMEDIINVIDGRAELLDEVDHAAANVREYLREEFDDLLADSSFVDGIGMHLRPDAVSQARVQRIIGSIRRLAGL
jgi:predicted nucleotidyltransferase